MEKQKPKYCRNCHYPLAPQAKYCSQCSQKYTTGKISVLHLLREFAEDHLHLNSKLFKTVAALIVPGKLTEEYFKGRHKRFASPLRLFLFSAIVFIAALSLSIPDNAVENDHFIELQEGLINKKMLKAVDSLSNDLGGEFQSTRVDQALDSLHYHLENQFDFDDTLRIEGEVELGGVNMPDIAVKDLIDKSPSEVIEAYGEDLTFLQKLFFTQIIKLFISGNSLLNYIVDKVSLAILFMMPFLAMILSLIYVRKKRYYVEHLIFSFHYHSFIFLVLSLMLFGFRSPSPELVLLIVGLFMGYLFLAMRTVYNQGWVKTFLKFMLLNFCYIILVSIFAILTILISFVLF
ncbi:MAG: DUF3667 domain-containing protein [Bacteroidota bacterium]